MDSRIGTEIAGYRIESLLARGGMGEVYLATQSFPQRKVALKLLPHELASDQAFRDRFTRESNAAASIEHPNVVPVYGAGDSNGELWIAMRYVEGEDLRSLLDREGPLPPDRTIGICAQIADALAEAHEHGLVHRDVKPGNILLAKGDRAYLSDFGLIRRSELETDLTKTGQFMGTIDYVAPEQIRGEEVDGRSDVYSLGALIYECLSGERPFPRDTEVATLYAHLQDPPPVPSNKNPAVPPELDAVVTKTMAKRPSDRYASARALAAALREAGGPAPRSAGRGRSAVLAGGVIAALVVLAVALLLVSNRDQGGGGGGSERAGVVLRQGFLSFDPTTHATTTRVPVPLPSRKERAGVAVPLSAGEGALWTTDRTGLLRVDPKTGTTEQIDVCRREGDAYRTIEGLAVGPGAAWVECGLSQLLRVDPFTYHVKAIDLPTGNRTLVSGSIAASPTNVWVALADDSIVEVDAVRGTVSGTLPGAYGEEIALGENRLWVARTLTSTVTPVDVRTGRPEPPIVVTGNIDALAVGEGGVWVLDTSGGIVTQIDPDTRTVRRTVGIGSGGTAVAAAFGGVWVTDPQRHSLTRIDPITGETETFDVHAAVTGVTADPLSGELWLTVQP